MTDHTFETLIPIYLDACLAEGKTAKTLAAYRESLHMYLRLAQAEGLPLSVDEVTVPDVYRYLAVIRRRGVGDATQHRRHREVKHLFSWLRKIELVAENPWQKVPLIRLEQQIIEPFSMVDIERLLAEMPATVAIGARNRALTLFLLDSGVRASEAVGLNLDDINFATGRARVLHGKGKKQRVVAFGPQVAAVMQDYLQYRGEDAGPLFQTKQGVRMRAQGLVVVYRRLGLRAGVVGVHPHRFRHTFATMAIRAAAREIDVQHLLGHSTSAMVRRYTRTYDAEQAAVAHARFSPVAQLGSIGTGGAVPALTPI